MANAPLPNELPSESPTGFPSAPAADAAREPLAHAADAPDMRRRVEHEIELEGLGTTLVRDIPGPEGAPTVMLLHGLGATARMNWGPCFRPLSRHFRVLSVDHRGHGHGLPTRRFRLEECADDAAAIAAARAVDRFIAVGWSMGGTIASLLWRRHAARVAGLVLCATGRHFVAKPAARALHMASPAVAGLARLAPSVARAGVIRRAVARAPRDDLKDRYRREFSGHDPAALVHAVRALSGFSSHDWISEIDVPTACVVTTRDGLVPASRQRRLAAAIPGAETFEVEGDHSACVTRADDFVPTLVGACRRVADRAALEARHVAPR